MEAIRQFAKVKNHQVNITLPEDFIADEVEVIIFARNENGYIIPEWQMKEVRKRTEEYLKNTSIAEDFEVAIRDIENELQLSKCQISLLDDRVNEPESEYIKSSESLNRIKEKYGF